MSGKKESLYSCAMAYGTMNLVVWHLAVVADACSSVVGIPTRPFTILVHHRSFFSGSSLLKLAIAEFVALMLRSWFVHGEAGRSSLHCF